MTSREVWAMGLTLIALFAAVLYHDTAVRAERSRARAVEHAEQLQRILEDERGYLHTEREAHKRLVAAMKRNCWRFIGD